MTNELTDRRFTFLNFSDDQSFDKVESSTGNNNSNKLPISMKQREASQCNTNSVPLPLLKIKPLSKYSIRKSIYPLAERPLWKIQCSDCNQKLGKIGARMGMHDLMEDEVKNIYVLRKKPQFQYAVEYHDSRILKFDSKILAVKHPKQMVQFLQKQAF